LIRDGSYGFLGEGPTLTERAALYQAVAKLEADARALWSYRVLARAARARALYNPDWYLGDTCAIAAAEALVAEDPSRGEGL
jgi:hypothetical protein